MVRSNGSKKTERIEKCMVRFPNRRRSFFIHFFLVCLLTVITLLPFAINLGDGFVSDDWEFLHTVVAGRQPLSHYFLTNVVGGHDGGTYRPLVNVFWHSAYTVFGLHPFGYHLTTTLLHLLNTFLVGLFIYLFLDRLESLWRIIGAYSGAVVFALLPNHAEAVSWISTINDTLATSFFLLALLTFIMFSRTSVWKKWVWLFASFVCFALALLTKEVALVFPGIVLIWTMFRCHEKFSMSGVPRSLFEYGKSLLSEAGRTLPYFFLLFGYVLARWQAIGLLTSDYAHVLVVTPRIVFRAVLSNMISHVLVGNERVWVTLRLFDHPIGVFFLMVFVVCTVWYWLPKHLRVRFVELCLFWIASFIPVMTFAVSTSMLYLSEEGGRFGYLPSVFFAGLVGLLIAAFLSRYADKKIPIVFGMGIFLAICGFLSCSLITKTWQWHDASHLAATSLDQAARAVSSGQYDGFVIIGVPDTWHGAFVFRNGFRQALEFATGKKHDSILVPIKTRATSEQKTLVTRLSTSTFLYTMTSGLPNFMSLWAGSSTDLSAELLVPLLDRSDDVLTGSGVRVELSKSFIQINAEKQKSIGLLFFDNGGWQLLRM